MRTENISGVTYTYIRYKVGEDVKDNIFLEGAYNFIKVDDIDSLLTFIKRMREIPGDNV